MAYVIGSQKGKEIAQSMKTGQTYKASDGSTWTKQSDGSVSVSHNGTVTNNAYKPTSSGGGSSGGGSSGGGSSTKKNSQYTTGNYTIGSAAGKNQADNMAIGSEWYASDGSKWVKENDGTITVYHNGTKTTGAYKPSDLGVLGQQQMASGVPWEDVMNTYNSRYNKATTTAGLEQYANDEIQQMMWQYIQDNMAKGNYEEAQNLFDQWKEEYEAENPKPEEHKTDPRIEQQLLKILNRDDFSYDVMNDPLYQQYAEMYQREGDRAMRETMANAMASAGGMNTYAMTAAQQAANYYSSQLNDKIPQLYQLAYEMYLQDKEGMVEDLGLLTSLDDTQYARYRDTMNDYYNDKNFAYGAYQDAINQGNWQTNFDYNSVVANRDFNYNDYWTNKQWNSNQEQQALENGWYEREWNSNQEQQALENGWYEREWNTNKDQYDKDQAKNEVWNLIELGVMPNADLIARAGMNEEDVKSAVAAVQAQNAPTVTTSKGGGGGGGGGGYEPQIETPKIEDTQLTEAGVCQEIYEKDGKEAVLDYLREAYAVGEISFSNYTYLFNQYRNK